MAFLLLLITSALAVSFVAGWFSIVGLMAIFPTAAFSIMVMGIVLEIAKLVTASWLYRNWQKAGYIMRTYFTTAVIVLSVITSMGIFGYLSKAHIEQTVLTGGGNALQISNLERKIVVEENKITTAQRQTDQLNTAVETLIDYDRIRGRGGATALRKAQEPERASLSQSIDTAVETIETYQEELLPLKTSKILLEAEVGPLKYIAELIYGESSTEVLDRAVRFVIMMLVFVFDPLAILLVIAANMNIMERRGESITFIGEKDLEKTEETFGIGPEATRPSPTFTGDSDEKPSFTEDDTEQFKRLDRGLRKKMEWIIDKKPEEKT